MKIALVRRRYTPYGGAERYMADLAYHLARAGHEVQIIGHRWPEDNELLKVRPVPMLRGPGWLEVLSFYRSADRFLARESFDVILSSEKNRFQHIFHGDDGCHREWLAQRRRYDTYWRRLGIRINPFHWITLSLEQRLFERNAIPYFVAIARRGADEYRRHYPCAQKRIRVIYNPMDLHSFAVARKNSPQTRQEKNLLFVGSGFFRKGLFFLLRALPILQKDGPLTLTVIGRDPFGPVYRLAEKLRVTERVRLIGPVNDPRPFYQEADLLVLPSIYEPFGNVVLEAMASGLPVVVSRFVGAAEWVRPGINGMVVNEPENPEELADAIRQALHLLPARVNEGNREIVPLFSWEVHLNALNALFEEILHRKKG